MRFPIRPSIVLLGLLVPGLLPGQDGKAAAGATAEPQFKNSKGGEAWKKGRELFDAESYREALVEMKKARDMVKAPADKDLVQGWVTACEGGVTLDQYRKMAEKGALRTTFFMASDAEERYRATPAGERLKSFADELRGKVLTVLETFDHASPRYSEKFGKTFVKDPAMVYRGESCLLWSSTKDGKGAQLKIDDVPQRWSPFHAIVFHIRCERPVEMQLLAMSPAGNAKSEEPSVMLHAFTPPSKPGWSRAQVELGTFKKHGSASFANVESFIFQIEGRTTFKIYIDEVALVNKDPSESSSAPVAEGKEDAKTSKKKSTTSSGKAKQTERKKA